MILIKKFKAQTIGFAVGQNGMLKDFTITLQKSPEDPSRQTFCFGISKDELIVKNLFNEFAACFLTSEGKIYSYGNPNFGGNLKEEISKSKDKKIKIVDIEHHKDEEGNSTFRAIVEDKKTKNKIVIEPEKKILKDTDGNEMDLEAVQRAMVQESKRRNSAASVINKRSGGSFLKKM